MTEDQQSNKYNLSPEEKVTQVMFYTSSCWIWGDLVTKEIIRVSTWLRTNAAPDMIKLFDAKLLSASGNVIKPVVYKEMHLPTSEVLAYHIIPPEKDPLDYDPNDGVRRVEPVTVHLGPFKFEGNILLAQKVDLTKYIEVTKEVFPTLYNAEISNVLMPSSGKISVQMLLYRFQQAILCTRD